MVDLRFNECLVSLVIDAGMPKRVTESVPARALGEGRYELLASPGMAPGFASGDEVRLAPETRWGFELVRRAGNVCIQAFFHPLADRELAEKLVVAAGGVIDGERPHGAIHLLVITIPADQGFPVIERMMQSLDQAGRLETWMYGNVYDPDDGVTPLNWWVQ